MRAAGARKAIGLFAGARLAVEEVLSVAPTTEETIWIVRTAVRARFHAAARVQIVLTAGNNELPPAAATIPCSITTARYLGCRSRSGSGSMTSQDE